LDILTVSTFVSSPSSLLLILGNPYLFDIVYFSVPSLYYSGQHRRM
jgi:hypothetical protein